MKLPLAAAALGLALSTSVPANAMNMLQPGMLTMMQQGGQEHGVQAGYGLPCSSGACPSPYAVPAWTVVGPIQYDARPPRRMMRGRVTVR